MPYAEGFSYVHPDLAASLSAVFHLTARRTPIPRSLAGALLYRTVRLSLSLERQGGTRCHQRRPLALDQGIEVVHHKDRACGLEAPLCRTRRYGPRCTAEREPAPPARRTRCPPQPSRTRGRCAPSRPSRRLAQVSSFRHRGGTWSPRGCRRRRRSACGVRPSWVSCTPAVGRHTW